MQESIDGNFYFLNKLSILPCFKRQMNGSIDASMYFSCVIEIYYSDLITKHESRMYKFAS